jgi:hypothetical protein
MPNVTIAIAIIVTVNRHLVTQRRKTGHWSFAMTFASCSMAPCFEMAQIEIRPFGRTSPPDHWIKDGSVCVQLPWRYKATRDGTGLHSSRSWRSMKKC